MDLFQKDKECFLPTYNRIPIDIAYGDGVHLVDKNGIKYLDFFAGLGVNALGYAHPGIVQAVTKQIGKFAHLSNSFITDIQVEFAELLLKNSGMSKLFLTNSGTEATEGAIKVIRKKHGPDKKIYSFTGAFHGRTYGALSLTAKEKYRKSFLPILPNIEQLPFNDIEALKNNISENTAAVFLEFLQGEGGINFVSEEFVSELKSLKEKYGFTLVSDTIQCGIGRTGKPFSHNHFDITPDIITSAKAIGGGLPLGAVMVKEELTNIFDQGEHGTTFGGNPVSCAAGLVVLKEVFENGLMEQVAELGKYFVDQLKELKNFFPQDIKEVRGKGFMLGVEFYYDSSSIVSALRSKKVLANSTNINVLRILPPLIAGKKDIDYFLYSLHEVLKEKHNGA